MCGVRRASQAELGCLSRTGIGPLSSKSGLSQPSNGYKISSSTGAFFDLSFLENGPLYATQINLFYP